MTSCAYTIYDLFLNIYGLIQQGDERRISKNSDISTFSPEFPLITKKQRSYSIEPPYYMSSDHLKTRLDGGGSCTTSSNSAINKHDKDKTAPLHAIMECRTGDEISLRFKDGSR
jgi:hypothetical protein